VIIGVLIFELEVDIETVGHIDEDDNEDEN
jgi:hypothetical protein